MAYISYVSAFETAAAPLWLPTGRCSIALVPSGPFHGFNRPDAKMYPGVIDNWWHQEMMGRAKLHSEGKAFSKTGQTEDLKKMSVLTHITHGDDDQILPYTDAGELPIKLLKNGRLKIYRGYSQSMVTTHEDVINLDILALSRVEPVRRFPRLWSGRSRNVAVRVSHICARLYPVSASCGPPIIQLL